MSQDIQYTIRSIPPKLDEALRMRAKKQGKSFNQTVVEALKQSAGITDEPVVYHDMDQFIGQGILDAPAFDRSQDWLESLPSSMS